MTNEPARIVPADNSRPLLRFFSKKQPAVAIDGAAARPLSARPGDSATPDGVRIVPTQNTAPAAAPGQPTAIERELQKLYDRDGRKMPPMRKPVAPNANSANGTAPFQVQPREGEAATQPGQTAAGKPGVLQRLNPFNKKAPQQPPTPPAATSRPPAPAVPVQPEARATTPSAPPTVPESNTASTAPRFDQTPPAVTPSSEIGSDFEDPFPEDSESRADRTTAPSRPATSSVPEPEGFALPRERAETPRPAVPETKPAAPPEKADDNPFTGLKLDAPPLRRETAPPPTAPARTAPSTPAASSVPSDNPFDAPRSEKTPPAEPKRTVEREPVQESLTVPTPSSIEETPAPRAESLPRATSRPAARSTPRPVEPESTPSFPAPSPTEEPQRRAEQPQLKFPEPTTARPAPEESPFEPPIVTTPAPKPAEPRETRSPSGSGWSPTRPRTESRTADPEIKPHAPAAEIRPREIPRTQPPKPLDPEPAAEVPTTKAQEHERKLRLIAQRRGQAGFKGFCPVTLRETRDLVDANPEFESAFEGATYHFASADAKAKFDRHPTRYAPASGGNDVILLGNFGREVPGSIEHALWYKDRLHLFSSRDSLETFLETLGSQNAQK